MEFKCNYCNKIFSSKSNLNTHIKTAKSCISSRNNDPEIEENIKIFKCEYCNAEYTSNNKLKNHLFNCTEYNFNIKYKEKIQELKEKELIIDQKSKELEFLKNHHEIDLQKIKQNYEVQINEYKNQIKELQDKFTELANNAIEKAIEKTTTTNEYDYDYDYNQFINNKNTDTYNTQNFTHIQAVNFSDENIQKTFEKLTYEDVYGGQPALAAFVNRNFFLDSNNRPLAVCNDKARQAIQYKNENNQVVKDPKAFQLVTKIAPHAEKAALRLKDQFVKTYLTKKSPKKEEKESESEGSELSAHNRPFPRNFSNFKVTLLRKKLVRMLCERLNINYDVNENKPIFDNKIKENAYTSILERLIHRVIYTAKILRKKSRKRTPNQRLSDSEDSSREYSSEYETDYEKYYEDIVEEDYFAEKDLKVKLEKLEIEKNENRKQEKAEEIVKRIEEKEWPQEKKDFYYQKLIKGIQDYQMLTINLCNFSKRLSMLLPSVT